MIRTRVGYSGGAAISPTYHEIGDHSEALEIDFDPSVITYGDLVRVFFQSHNPTRHAWSVQYRSALFPRSPDQRGAAELASREVSSRLGAELTTAIEDFSGFTLAEDYHQKYRLRAAPKALAEFGTMFPTTDALVASPAATFANALAGGYGTTADLRDSLESLGLSPGAQDQLRRAAKL